MPITITLPVPGTTIGPGYRLGLTTDFLGPIPSDWFFNVTIGKETEGTPSVMQLVIPAIARDVSVIVGERSITSDKTDDEVIVAADDVHINAELREQNQTVIDSGSRPAKWDPINYLWAQANANVGGQVTGGFTAQDRATLQENNQLSLAIQDATQVALPGLPANTTLPLASFFEVTPLDVLTTVSLSGGVTCDPVRVDVSSSNFTGVQLAIASYPIDWQFRTPDGAWGFHDLAVLTFVRGGITLKRLGIHTTQFTEQPLPGQLLPWAVGLLGVAIIPRDYQIHVDWAEGVCGELRGLRLP